MHYHTSACGSGVQLRIPVQHKARDCTDHLGCEELYDDDLVSVEGIPGNFRVHLYKNSVIR